MLFRLIVFILPLLLAAKSYAANTPKEAKKETITFFTYQAGASNINGARLETSPWAQKTSSKVEVPISEITDLIKSLRANICKSAKKSNIRVWLSADASGKILGVGASGQGGIEVTFQCE